jgi:hypothetical protein
MTTGVGALDLDVDLSAVPEFDDDAPKLDQDVVVVPPPAPPPPAPAPALPPISPPTWDLVLTHYDERIEWLNVVESQKPRRIFVYHKGTRGKGPADYGLTLKGWDMNGTSMLSSLRGEIPGLEWIEAKDVGRDSETICRHALDVKRGKIPGLQADGFTIFTHCAEWTQRSAHVFPIAKLGEYRKDDYVSVYGEWITAQQIDSTIFPRDCAPCPLDFAEYYELVTGRERPPSGRFFVSYCNSFGVRNSRLLAHSADVYDRALCTLRGDANPKAAHYFERLCRTLFGSNPFIAF